MSSRTLAATLALLSMGCGVLQKSFSQPGVDELLRGDPPLLGEFADASKDVIIDCDKMSFPFDVNFHLDLMQVVQILPHIMGVEVVDDLIQRAPTRKAPRTTSCHSTSFLRAPCPWRLKPKLRSLT